MDIKKQIKDGGPAFPQPLAFNGNGEAVCAGMYFAEGCGMTLRDYFAARAMQAMTTLSAVPSNEQIAIYAYAMADAMIKEREVAHGV